MLLNNNTGGSGGDSGGPMFSGPFALGVYKGSPGGDALYMAIDFIEYLGIYVLVQ
jgi:hypothetical protein